MNWFGADPGGEGKFGVAWLHDSGTFETDVRDCAQDALRWIQKRGVAPSAIGIDCPLWWSSLKSGERQVDVLLRKKYRVGSSVLSLNSLRGGALVQGMMLACDARKQWEDVTITETHPTALLKATHLKRAPWSPRWSTIAKKFDFKGDEPEGDDRKDALLSAVAARNGYQRRWTVDLTDISRSDGEMDPQHTFFGNVNYYWFEPITS